MSQPVVANSNRNWLPTFSRVASAFVVVVGCLVLLGWALGWPPLIRLLPTMVAMNPVTALLFIGIGISLWRLGRPLAESQKKLDYVRLTLAGLVAALGALRLADYAFGLNLHIEQLLFAERVTAVGVYPPSDMAPNTAFDFLLCGIALLLFDVETPRGFRLSQVLILVPGLVALVALIGYSYRILFFYRVGVAIPMALETAIAFAVFSLGFLAARPYSGLMIVITSATTGGAVSRRLLPVALLVPWLLGVLLLMGQQAGYYQQEYGLSLFAVTSILIFTGLIWWNAKLLYQADLERARTERRLAVQHNATRIMAEAHNLAEAMPKLLQTVCEILGWQAGGLWMVDASASAIRCAEFWHLPSATLAEFAEASRKLTFGRGVGLPGRVWAAGQPVWIADSAADAGLPRLPLAARAGLHGALGFPIRLAQQTLGMMEFHSREIEPPDEAMLEMFAGVGTQLGLFIERTRAEEQLRQATAELQRSNTELQQFAYVASHDLFEPLRMVISYLQLLSQRCQGKLDKPAQEFIGFAVDGAQRMQALIQDLLAYSRVGIRGRAFEPTDCEAVFKAALGNLKVAIEETNAAITHQPLPRVKGDSVQLTQVFQNLVGNAIKFRGPEPPRVEVGAHPREGEWLFFVRDNGIGIDSRHFARIFEIFQRLHTREEYTGTGMGLAICKKIIERHGGRMWVESSPGKGSTFFFSLPVMAEG